MATTRERFANDVAEHTLTILKDDGVYRHIRLSNNGSSVYRFDLITWPGYLAYVGDMGSYVFRRIDDMFCFFRNHKEDSELKINLGYWSEKVEAYCRDGVREFSSDLFESQIDECLAEFLEDSDLTEEQIQELKDEVEEQVKSMSNSGRDEAISAAVNYEWDGDSIFPEFYEYQLEQYTYRFEWCCWAMVWGIRQYDDFKAKQRAELVKKIEAHWVGCENLPEWMTRAIEPEKSLDPVPVNEKAVMK